MKSSVLYIEKEFANKVFAIENRFEKMGPNLLLINSMADYDKYFGSLYRDINLLSGIFKHFNSVSPILRETIDYYLDVYFGYLEIVSYIIEFKSLYNQNPSFVLCDDRLFSSYNRVASLIAEKTIIAPKFFDNLTILIQNLAERYGYGQKLYRIGDNVTFLSIDEGESSKIKVYPTLV